MSSARIFVSYPLVGDEQSAAYARRFIADLKASGAEVITDNEHVSDKRLVSYLYREFRCCEYFILIQTPQSLHSLRVQNAMNLALQVAARQRMKGVLRLIATPTEAEEEQLSQVMPRAFDASKDYPRARDRILLELGLLSLDAEEAEQEFTPRPVSPLASQRTQLSATQPALPAPALSLHSDRPTTPLWRARLARPRWWIRLAIGIVALALVLSATLVAIQAAHHGPLAVSQVQRTVTRITTPARTRPTATAFVTPGIGRTPASGINPQSTVDLYGGGSTLALRNDLTSGNDSTPYQWFVSPGGQEHGCSFINHTYDISSQGPNYCPVGNTNFASFVYQIQMKILQGPAGGIIFRANETASTYYLFEITTDGHFFVLRSDSLRTAPVQISAGSGSAIHTEPGASNVIAVKAIGTSLILYVNATAIAQMSDSNYSRGGIGVIAGQSNDQGITEVAYTYARVWTT